MAKVLGIINEAEIENQTDLSKYEEVSLYGFKQARENDPNIEEGARDVEENGVYVDEVYGKQLFDLAINSVVFDIEKLLDFKKIKFKEFFLPPSSVPEAPPLESS